MDLVIDIGNSYIKCALFNNEKITKFKQYKTSDKFNLNDYKDNDFFKVIISSVVKDKLNEVKASINKIKKVKIIDIANLKKNIKLKVNVKPNEIGSDLYADLIASRVLYPNSNCIIFDIGTVSKVLALTKDNTFIGGSFYPGHESSKNSLDNETDALPNVELKNKFTLIGKDTNECIHSGIYYSSLFAIKGFSASYSKEMNSKTIKIITGGGAKALKSKLKGFKYEPYLTLLGIYYIYKENNL